MREEAARGRLATRSRSGLHRRWLGDEVHEHSGTIREMADRVPTFRRQPLAIPNLEGTKSTVNWSRDLIVKCASPSGGEEVPIGVVSKQYRLVQHTTVLAHAAGAIESAGISLSRVACDLGLTTNGERMALRIRLPGQYDFDPGDGHPMALRLECFNSVEASCRFMAVMGWLRFVCENGLVIGISRGSVRGRHDRHLEIEEVGQVLAEGLRSADVEKAVYATWISRHVKQDLIRSWVDGHLADSWGKKAAARAFHICRTGCDAEFEDPFERAKPSQRTMKPSRAIPGAAVPARNVFSVSQALSWLAGARGDIQEQLDWRRQIPRLMEALMN